VAPIFNTWTIQGGADEQMILMLLANLGGDGIGLPVDRSSTAWFVDNVVLHRPDYDMLLAQASQSMSRQDSAESILEDLKELIGPALSARSVQWRVASNQNRQTIQNVVETELAAPQSSYPLWNCPNTLYPSQSSKVAVGFYPTTSPQLKNWHTWLPDALTPFERPMSDMRETFVNAK